ncbi:MULTISPECIES: OB-fold domain-containing protein [Caulobacter]|uniref:3-hydroxy-3-methylglutaryl CoA synthase n=1 Tax=Caulobacter vibrioides OR37 TaxID=1292034 RepID=R0EEL7_CAUVI|nr:MULTISPECIES: OB-fold domain-containing protein [Caulobacter]ENZ83873.1 3-hydroxy-3-methylglutaryl CoA synthase [Caulobacter vibrioides OR37]MBQ1562943.1 hydroxymethylglutaryl-CoA synthase family protein [Caulobacter sp.]
MAGIAAWGAYAPRLRLSRKAVTEANAWVAPNLRAKGKGERSMANWDEDALTMAVEAARDALGPDDDRSHIESLYFASTTAPFVDRLNAGVISAALTLEKSIAASDVTGSQRCGLTALGQALAAGGRSLVTIGEHRKARAASTQELDFGDGAAAFVISDEPGAAELLGRGSVTDDFVDHFRGDGGGFDYYWEERWIRDEGIVKLVPPAIRKALEAAGLSPGQVDQFCFPSTFSGMAATVAKAVGIRAEAVRDNLGAVMGEAGCAHGPIMLAHALEDARENEVVLVAQFGQGAEALVFRATGQGRRPARGVTGALADREPETNYLKFLTFNGLIEWDKGMRAEKDNKTALTTLYRNEDMILGLVGGRCRETGVVQFPRTRISVAPNNPAVDTQEPYRFAERRANVLSYSADYLTFSMAPPNHYGMIVFEGGGRIMMDITDVSPGDVETGLPVRMVFRVKEVDEKRGFVRYFWKAAPDRAAIAARNAQAAE